MYFTEVTEVYQCVLQIILNVPSCPLFALQGRFSQKKIVFELFKPHKNIWSLTCPIASECIVMHVSNDIIHLRINKSKTSDNCSWMGSWIILKNEKVTECTKKEIKCLPLGGQNNMISLQNMLLHHLFVLFNYEDMNDNNDTVLYFTEINWSSSLWSQCRAVGIHNSLWW